MNTMQLKDIYAMFVSYMDSNMCTCGGDLRTHNSGTMCT
jgi:hypothetical protein